ncbi:MAG: serine/threonine protein kinase, partial [Deltaproteobacteria bacterium]|nr:serine/threonine protein kinase [Deltaproteobacteria bacterium]
MPSPVPGGLAAIGKYDIEARLGQGGMGDVYLGKHQLLGRHAAIKVLKPKYAKRRELTERFFREARIAAALKHPA